MKARYSPCDGKSYSHAFLAAARCPANLCKFSKNLFEIPFFDALSPDGLRVTTRLSIHGWQRKSPIKFYVDAIGRTYPSSNESDTTLKRSWLGIFQFCVRSWATPTGTRRASSREYKQLSTLVPMQSRLFPSLWKRFDDEFTLCALQIRLPQRGHDD